jgi:hypothetical protein
MVTAAVFMDLNADKKPDLLLAGDWMPIMTFKNTGTTFENQPVDAFKDSDGMWAAIEAADLDGDGDLDFIFGNAGLNNQYKATPERPLTIYYDDFDKNGAVDPICTYYIGNKSYPMFSRDEMLDQMTFLKRKYTSYAAYADATMEDVFGKEAVEKSKKVYCKELRSMVFENLGNFGFKRHSLPDAVQFSRTSGIVVQDLDSDGKAEVVLAGNFSPYRVQLGPCDASVGVVLRQETPFRFEPVSPSQTGLWASGDIRQMALLNSFRILITVNDGQPVLLEWKK